MKKFVFAAALAAMTLSAQAESSTVGTISVVQGNVTVSSNGEVLKAVIGTQVSSSSTILTSGGSKATIVFNDGCVIPVKANQHLVLDPKLTCSQQYAAIVQLAAPYRLAQAPVGGAATGGGGVAGGFGALAVAGGIIAVGVVAIETTDSDPVSGR